MMTLTEYRKLYNEEIAVGWQAIETHLEQIYPNLSPEYKLSAMQASEIKTENLEGMCHYSTTDFEHYISFGFTELYYNEECIGNDFSKFGFELSLRLDKQNTDNQWVYRLLQHLANYVFESGNWFEPNHFIEIERGITLSDKDNYAGIAFMIDPILNKIQTPHGMVEFLQVIPLYKEEIKILSKKANLSFTEKFLQEKTINNKLSIISL